MAKKKETAIEKKVRELDCKTFRMDSELDGIHEWRDRLKLCVIIGLYGFLVGMAVRRFLYERGSQ